MNIVILFSLSSIIRIYMLVSLIDYNKITDNTNKKFKDK